MSCEICGRSSYTRSFHSLEEQERFDNGYADQEDCESKEVNNSEDYEKD